MLWIRTCAACGRAANVLCPTCQSALAPAPALAPPDGIDSLWALLAYEGPGRDLVTAFKYHARRRVAALVGPALAGLVDQRFDTVTWLPTTPSRRRVRGYDQARLLARVVARELDVAPAASLLGRRHGPPQTGRRSDDRATGPVLVARRVPPHRSPVGQVLVVDDVVTTGASMCIAARALRAAGADAVSGLALARTPLKPATRSAESVR